MSELPVEPRRDRSTEGSLRRLKNLFYIHRTGYYSNKEDTVTYWSCFQWAVNRSGVKLSSLANWLMLASWLSEGKTLKAEEWRAGLRKRKCSSADCRSERWVGHRFIWLSVCFFLNMIFIIKYIYKNNSNINEHNNNRRYCNVSVLF